MLALFVCWDIFFGKGELSLVFSLYHVITWYRDCWALSYLLIRLLFYSISLKIKVATELKTEHYLTLRLLNRSELIMLTSVTF